MNDRKGWLVWALFVAGMLALTIVTIGIICSDARGRCLHGEWFDGMCDYAERLADGP